jgi:hypothetical protein
MVNTMAERTKDSMPPHALSEVISDLADLFQKEFQLARVEMSEKLSDKLRASVWMGLAGIFGIFAIFFVLETVVLGISTLGIPLHWSCLIVAGVLGIATGVAYAIGRAKAQEQFVPTRTMHQIKHDISTAKEQLT